MIRKLMTVEDTFKITGRGLILVGKFNDEIDKLKIGDPIIVVTPKKEKLGLTIKGVELITRIDRSQPYKHSSFSVGYLVKEDVPVGSEVFIED